jgi:hypothetical protein
VPVGSSRVSEQPPEDRRPADKAAMPTVKPPAASSFRAKLAPNKASNARPTREKPGSATV